MKAGMAQTGNRSEVSERVGSFHGIFLSLHRGIPNYRGNAFTALVVFSGLYPRIFSQDRAAASCRHSSRPCLPTQREVRAEAVNPDQLGHRLAAAGRFFVDIGF